MRLTKRIGPEIDPWGTAGRWALIGQVLKWILGVPLGPDRTGLEMDPWGTAGP